MYSPFAYRNKWRASCNQGFFINYVENLYRRAQFYFRDVTTGATGATTVAPKFSDTSTLSQPRGGRFCPPLQRSQLKFFSDYVPAMAHPDFGRSVNPISTKGGQILPTIAKVAAKIFP